MKTRAESRLNWNVNDVGEEWTICTNGYTNIRIAARAREGAWGTAVFGVGYKISESDVYRDFSTPVTITSAAPVVLVDLEAVPFVCIKVSTAEGAEDSIDIEAFMTDQQF